MLDIDDIYIDENCYILRLIMAINLYLPDYKVDIKANGKLIE